MPACAERRVSCVAVDVSIVSCVAVDVSIVSCVAVDVSIKTDRKQI